MHKSIFMVLFCLFMAVPSWALNKAPLKELVVASDGEFTSISLALASLPTPNPDTNPAYARDICGKYNNERQCESLGFWERGHYDTGWS